jgi:hypothetical protein
MNIVPISQVLSLPGAEFSRQSLTISESATPKQLKLIGDFLSQVGDAEDWWKADYVKTCASRGSPTQAATLCQEQGMEQSSFDFYLSVSSIFPPSLRVESLSFDHHKEALLGSDHNQSLALEWLKKAEEEEWDVPTLRKNIRQSLATYQRDALPPTGNGYSAIIDAERWARTQSKQLSSYTPERAKAILSDISTLRDLIDKLEAIAANE